MQDRFKFRVWDETEKNMVYFDGIFYNKKPYTEGSSFPQYESSPHYHKLSDLMQCTGLKDKNGKLIYEGDILVDIARLDKILYIVKWNKLQAQFCIEMVNPSKYELYAGWNLGRHDLDYEAIGNIYENPELLEV